MSFSLQSSLPLSYQCSSFPGKVFFNCQKNNYTSSVSKACTTMQKAIFYPLAACSAALCIVAATIETIAYSILAAINLGSYLTRGLKSNHIEQDLVKNFRNIFLSFSSIPKTIKSFDYNHYRNHFDIVCDEIHTAKLTVKAQTIAGSILYQDRLVISKMQEAVARDLCKKIREKNPVTPSNPIKKQRMEDFEKFLSSLPDRCPSVNEIASQCQIINHKPLPLEIHSLVSIEFCERLKKIAEVINPFLLSAVTDQIVQECYQHIPHLFITPHDIDPATGHPISMIESNLEILNENGRENLSSMDPGSLIGITNIVKIVCCMAENRELSEDIKALSAIEFSLLVSKCLPGFDQDSILDTLPNERKTFFLNIFREICLQAGQYLRPANTPFMEGYQLGLIKISS